MTPYHVFLSLSFLHYNEEDLILLLDENDLLSSYVQCVKIKNFSYVNFPSKFGLKSKIKSFLTLKERIRQLCTYLDLNKVNNVYVFNDNSPYSQKTIKSLKCKNVFYIEDGSAPYNDHFIKNGGIKRIEYSIFFGFSYDFTNVLGTSKFIKNSFFTYPELVREENKKNSNNKYLTSSNWRNKVEQSHCNLDGYFPYDKKKHRIILVLLPLLCDEKTKTYFYNLVIEKLNVYDGVYVKYHPLSKNEYNLFDSIPGVVILPSFISSELVMTCNGNISEIYTNLNTSSISSTFFFNNVIVNILYNEADKQSYLFQCIYRLSCVNKNINFLEV